MAVFLDEYRLSYLSVPKVACTSLKRFFFEVENKRAFEPFKINGEKKYLIHMLYPSLAVDKIPIQKIANHRKFAVVRDPIKRFLSFYRNRVVHHQDINKYVLKNNKLFREGCTINPSLDNLIDHFELYRKIQKVKHHTDPLTIFLGHDPEFFEKIYSIDQLASFAEDMNQIVGQQIALTHVQTGGPTISMDVLSQAQLVKLKKFYEKDYDIYGKFF